MNAPARTDAVVGAAHRVTLSRVDAPHGIPERHRRLQFGRLTQQRHQRVGLAEHARHLVHDATRRAGDEVLGLLAQQREVARPTVQVEARAAACMTAVSTAADELTPLPSGTRDAITTRAPEVRRSPARAPARGTRR